ncbi:MAG TPA: rhodanese-like domain-containing protein [Clostridia bacterium]|nr:rhodanese-like domain-containing protein [Clostridia bacterium]
MTFRHRWKTALALVMLGAMALVLIACSAHDYAESGKKIVPAASLSSYIGNGNVVIVDMQDAESYAAGHVQGAVNITREDIVISVPVANTLTSKNKLQKLLGQSGIGNDTTIVVYDDDKMSAARFFWTMLVYGSENVLVVDGGLSAVKAAGIPLTADVPEVTPVEYVAGERDDRWLATAKDVLAQVDEPQKNVVLLDVRTDAEYAESGKVPSSILWDYADNFYKDGTFKSIETTRINYIQKGMQPEKDIIVYCQTSMRAAPVFLRLYDAGYRNIRIYDGAYLEWSSNPNNPVDMPSGAITPSVKDAS